LYINAIKYTYFERLMLIIDIVYSKVGRNYLHKSFNCVCFFAIMFVVKLHRVNFGY